MEEQNQKKTPSYLNAFLTVLLSFGTNTRILGGLAFVYWAFNNPEMMKQCSLLENVRFKKTKDQIKLLSTILFVNILAVLGLGILRMILLKLNKFPESSPAMVKMQHYAWKCLQHSIVSLSFYAFILTQGRYNLTNQQLTIFALCIMASILTMCIGSGISSLLNYNFVQLGIMMNSVTNVLMLGEMMGFELLSYI